MPQETDYAWLAGIIDGEGSIFVSRVKVRENHRGYQYRPQLSISNSDDKMMESVKSIIGSGSVNRISEKRLDWKDRYVYMGNSNTMRKVLPRILPYLVTKRRQAEKTLELLKYLSHCTRGEYPPIVQELYEQIKYANQKGKQARLLLPQV